MNRRLQILGRAIRHIAKFYKAEIPKLVLKDAQTIVPRKIMRKSSADK